MMKCRVRPAFFMKYGGECRKRQSLPEPKSGQEFLCKALLCYASGISGYGIAVGKDEVLLADGIIKGLSSFKVLV